ncbi:hypothetical protein [Roseibium sp.]|uniref:hypothetical protein n=1 Tax=Roseibium sp. TaxID=1936156 RepID=UPI003B5081F3
MAYITNEQIEAASGNHKSGIWSRIAAGFVSVTNHCYEQAKHRLPVMHESELADKEGAGHERLADSAYETELDLERKERSDSRGYLSPEHYNYMYY